MSDKGRKDKGKKDKLKEAQHTLKEKRKIKKAKHAAS
jgi:hypothetical protein